MVYYHTLSYVIIYFHFYYHLLSYIINYYRSLSFSLLYYHLLSFVFMYYHTLSYIIMYYHVNYHTNYHILLFSRVWHFWIPKNALVDMGWSWFPMIFPFSNRWTLAKPWPNGSCFVSQVLPWRLPPTSKSWPYGCAEPEPAATGPGTASSTRDRCADVLFFFWGSLGFDVSND